MKIRIYTALFLVFLFAVNGCKHNKSSSSKKKSKKTAVVKSDKPAKTVSKAPASVKSIENNEFGQKLGLSQKEISNNKLFVFINDWYGVPYKYGGCQKSGVDCSCFTNLLYETVYHTKTGRSANEMYDACEKILLDEAQEGDLIFFKINGNTVSHVGVYLKNNLFVHSSTSKGVIINSVDEAYYKKYFHSGGRMKHS